jgi:hypothetical protein
MGNAAVVLTPYILSSVLLAASLGGAFTTAWDSDIELVRSKIGSSVRDLYYHFLSVDGTGGERQTIGRELLAIGREGITGLRVARAAPSTFVRRRKVDSSEAIRQIVTRGPRTEIRTSERPTTTLTAITPVIVV